MLQNFELRQVPGISKQDVGLFLLYSLFPSCLCVTPSSFSLHGLCLLFLGLGFFCFLTFVYMVGDEHFGRCQNVWLLPVSDLGLWI